jgi:hypothetical protein
MFYWHFEAFKKNYGMICRLFGLVVVVFRSLYGAPYHPELALLVLHTIGFVISMLLNGIWFSEIVISICFFVLILIYFYYYLIQ